MQESLLEQGITLMLVGMGTVFVFLTLLVTAMSVLAKLSQRFMTSAATAAVTEDEVAAITAAIIQHRKQN